MSRLNGRLYICDRCKKEEFIFNEEVTLSDTDESAGT